MIRIIELTIDRMGVQLRDAMMAAQGTGVIVCIAGLAMLGGARGTKWVKRKMAQRKSKKLLEKRFAEIVKKSKEEDRWLQR